MHWLSNFLRNLAKLRFRALKLATIKDIPTDRFNQLVNDLMAVGWRKTYEYDNYDVWIDYGCIKLSKGNAKLKLEWDNYFEGSIEGPSHIIEDISKISGLKDYNSDVE